MESADGDFEIWKIKFKRFLKDKVNDVFSRQIKDKPWIGDSQSKPIDTKADNVIPEGNDETDGLPF